jgi:parallel beta helix pectate lyase-like protein
MRQTEKNHLGIFLLFVCLLFVSELVSPVNTDAMEYYVAKDGNDTKSGTKSAPVQTIRKGISLLSKSDTLYIKEGIYEETIDSQKFAIPTGTSWENAPVIAAYPGDVVILRPNGAWAAINLVHSYIQYVIFNGLIVDGINMYWKGDGISMTNGANHVRFHNMEVKNAPRHSVLLTTAPSENDSGISSGGTFNEFIGGKYHDTDVLHNPDLPKGGYNFYIITDNNLIDGAEIYNATGHGFHIYHAFDPRPSHNIVRNCRVYGNGIRIASSPGILLGSGDGNMAYNNLIYDGHGYGIKVGVGATNSLVYNNSVYNSYWGGIAVGEGDGSAINTIVKNNILFKNRPNYSDKGTGTIESNNIDEKDPLFIDETKKDFHLKSGSPAINAGVELAEVTVDFNGNARPKGAPYDIGAFEFNQSTVGTPKNLLILSAQ